MQDKDLLTQLLARDKKVLFEFYQTYSSRLLHFIRLRIDNEADVEEIAQDTLFAFLEQLRDFQGDCSINTYLCAIANRKVIDFYRKRKFKKIVFSQLPKGVEPLLSELLDPQKLCEDAWVAQKIKSAFKLLLPQYARALTLKYIEGRSVEEIAQKLSCSFKSAESVLFRARRAFVRFYQQ